MNYSKIIYYDTANSHGLSTTLFVSGCRLNCPNCFNKEQQNFSCGQLYTQDVEDKIISSLNDTGVRYLVLTGGHPLEEENATALIPLVKRVNHETKAEIICYTGYDLYADLFSAPVLHPEALLLISQCDYLIDGRYDESRRTEKRELRGSLNQHCYVRTEMRQFVDISMLYFDHWYNDVFPYADGQHYFAHKMLIENKGDYDKYLKYYRMCVERDERIKEVNIWTL